MVGRDLISGLHSIPNCSQFTNHLLFSFPEMSDCLPTSHVSSLCTEPVIYASYPPQGNTECLAWNLGYSGSNKCWLMDGPFESKMIITGQLIMLMDEGKESKTHQYKHDCSLLCSNFPFCVPPLPLECLAWLSKRNFTPFSPMLTLIPLPSTGTSCIFLGFEFLKERM